MSLPVPWHFDPITGQYLEPTKTLVISPFRNKWFELIRREGHLVEHGPAPLKECKDMAAFILQREKVVVNGHVYQTQEEAGKSLRGGIGCDVMAVPRKPKRNAKKVQEALVGLVLRYGSNVANWNNYRECLAEVDLTPEAVEPSALVRAVEQAAVKVAQILDQHKDRQKMRELSEVKVGRGFRVPYDYPEDRFRGWHGVKTGTLPEENCSVTLFKGCTLELKTWSERTVVVYEPEVRLPKLALPVGQVVEETEMRVVNAGARKLLKIMGLVIADDPEALSVEKLQERLNDLPKFLECGGKEPEEGSEDRELFEACMKAIKKGKPIRIGDFPSGENGRQEKNPSPEHKAAKPSEFSALTEKQWDILKHLNGNGPQTRKQLAKGVNTTTEKIVGQTGYADPEINKRQVHQHNLLNRGFVCIKNQVVDGKKLLCTRSPTRAKKRRHSGEVWVSLESRVADGC